MKKYKIEFYNVATVDDVLELSKSGKFDLALKELEKNIVKRYHAKLDKLKERICGM